MKGINFKSRPIILLIEKLIIRVKELLKWRLTCKINKCFKIWLNNLVAKAQMRIVIFTEVITVWLAALFIQPFPISNHFLQLIQKGKVHWVKLIKKRAENSRLIRYKKLKFPFRVFFRRPLILKFNYKWNRNISSKISPCQVAIAVKKKD